MLDLYMECVIREWTMEDAARLAEILNNKNKLRFSDEGVF